MAPTTSSGRRQALLAVLALALLAGLLAARTWRAWPDPLIDQGRELYAAWRISLGDELHRDLAWFNGPFSAWWNGAVFGLLGPSAGALFLSNALWLTLALLAAERLLRCLADPPARTMALAAALVFVGFTQLGGVGNYDWLAPYSHELTHGVTLALWALVLAQAAARRPTVGASLASGLLLGAVLLTKVEVALAALPATLPALATLLRRSPYRARHLASLGLGFALPPAAALTRLSPALGAGEALAALGLPFEAALDPRVRALPFYRSGAGLDDPAAGLTALARSAGAAALLLGPALVLAAALRRPARTLVLAVALAQGLAAWIAGSEADWVRAFRFLPLVPLALLLASLPRSGRGFENGERSRERLGLALLALLLLAKILLLARIASYGFALSLPALLVLVALGVGTLPAVLTARGRAGVLARAAAIALWAGLGAVHLGQDAHWRRHQRHALGTGGDRMVTDGRGAYAAEALADLERRLEPGEPFLVLPEGVMLNYLARRPTPTRHLNFMPPELLLFGEESIARELREADPRVVVLVHKDTSEYGVPRFGSDYGAAIGEWLVERYEVQRVIGALPLASHRFGIAILERRH